MKRRLFLNIADLLWYLLGSIIYAISVTVFLTPNEITPGGLTGIAELLTLFLNVSSGILLMLLNLPVLMLGLIKFGGIFIIKTFIATAFASFSISLCESVLKEVKIDRMLASIMGGVLMGLGLSIVLLHGATTGGVDIIAKLINRRFPHLTVGKLILLFDGIVVLLAALAYRNIESALYSVVTMYISSRLMDTVLYGADKGKIIYIISKNWREISNDINNTLERGITLLDAAGGYTGNKYKMLMCTVRRHEVADVYRLIRSHDENAFTVVADAGEIIGEGFKPFEK